MRDGGLRRHAPHALRSLHGNLIQRHNSVLVVQVVVPASPLRPRLRRQNSVRPEQVEFVAQIAEHGPFVGWIQLEPGLVVGRVLCPVVIAVASGRNRARMEVRHHERMISGHPPACQLKRRCIPQIYTVRHRKSLKNGLQSRRAAKRKHGEAVLREHTINRTDPNTFGE